jgi:hypothetical protein
MHRRVRFFSDDSYASCRQGKRHDFVVAGVAIEYDRTNVSRALLEAEQSTQKGRRDWFRTPRDKRERYLEAVLGINSIRGRIFYCPFDCISKSQYWQARLDALGAAIIVFTPGHCQHLMAHDGLQGNSRHQLRRGLSTNGHTGVVVESGQFENDPEIRLADAIAGYVRSELYRGDGQRSALTNIPDFFVDLEPKIRNPPA